MRFTVVACAIAGLFIGSSHATTLDYPSAWECSNQKFNWYCDEERKTDEALKNPTAESKEDEAAEWLAALQKDLQRKKALAIKEPTPENLKSYIQAQEFVMERSAVFADTWRRVIWTNPELNYELKNPVNAAGMEVQKASRSKTIDEELSAIAKDWGIFFFFQSDCQFCHRLAPILHFFAKTYGFNVMPISLDGKGIPDYPKPMRDNGMAAQLKLTSVPVIYAGNPKTRQLIPIASGVVANTDLRERVYTLLRTKPGDQF